MLLGRERECAEIDSALDLARAGTGGVLLVRGDPGIGKSALLARSVDDPRGMRVLHAQGFEVEAEIGYSVLTDLCRPLAGEIGELPVRLRDAITTATGAAPGHDVSGAFAVGRALTTLLQTVCAREPVLVAVDDGHWVDEASAAALAFAARRLAESAVLFLVTLRNGESSVFDTLDVPSMRLEGLARDAADVLVGEEVRELAGDRVCEHIHETARGNPLALLELSDAAREGDLDPDEDVVPAGPRLVRAFGARLSRLPPATSLALMVVAASFTGDCAEVDGALGRLGRTNFDLDLARVEGLLWLEGDRWQMRHPIFRSVAYQRFPPEDRRTVHRAFASWLAENGGGEPGIAADQRAWHAAAAAADHDEQASALLADVAVAARSRGALAAARRAYLRARELTTDREIRALMSIGAAACAQLSGDAEAALLLAGEAIGYSRRPGVRSEADRVRHAIILARSAAVEVLELFEADAARIRDSDPDLAATLLGAAAATAITAHRLQDTVRLSEQGIRLAKTLRGGSSAYTIQSYGLVSSGRAPEASRVLAKYYPDFRTDDPWEHSFEAVGCTGMVLVWLGMYQEAADFISRTARRLRSAGAEEHLPLLLIPRALLALRTGAWEEAHEAVEESRILGSELGQWQVAPLAVALAARLAALRGDFALARDLSATTDQLTETTGASFYRGIGHAALGTAELMSGHPEEAVAILARVRDEMTSGGMVEHSVFAPTLGDFVEALIRSGAVREARAAVAAELPLAEAGGLDAVLAVAYRCQAQVAAKRNAAAWYAKAFEHHGRSLDPYELARTELAHGRALRAAGRAKAARAALQRAVDRFAALGAVPWQRAAAVELDLLSTSARFANAHLAAGNAV